MIVSRTISGAEPVLAADAKLFLKVDYLADDTLISEMISGFREMIEEIVGRSLVASTIVYERMVEAGEEVDLPYPNHGEITSVTKAGEAVTDYTESGTYRKVLTFGTAGRYVITYTTTAYSSSLIKTMIKKHVARNYETRNGEINLNSEDYALLMPLILP